LSFAQRAKERTAVPLLVTGGFKRKAEVSSALLSGGADAVGLGRALVINPDLPDEWTAKATSTLSPDAADPVFPRFDSPPPGGVTAWYTMRLTALANGHEAGMSDDLAAAITAYEQRDAQRRDQWQKRIERAVNH